jgi:hypothetical protein
MSHALEIAKTISQELTTGAEVNRVSILAIVQSIALATTLVLVWVSIAIAEDLREGGAEEPEPTVADFS